MASPIDKPEFLADLHARIAQHAAAVDDTFAPLDDDALTWRPEADEWSVLECFAHLNRTHDYYRPKIAQALRDAETVGDGPDTYQPSLWGRIYMHFAFNPRYSFPTAEEITPRSDVDRSVLDAYLTRQADLTETLSALGDVALSETAVPIRLWVRFNLGDCLKILVYHDGLHIDQANRVLEARRERM